MYSNEDYLLELITEAGLVTAEEIEGVRSKLDERESVVERLITSQRLTEEQVARVSAQSASMPFIDLGAYAHCSRCI